MCPHTAQGERRFYLGAVVDDLFLKTPEFTYGAGGFNELGNPINEGPVCFKIELAPPPPPENCCACTLDMMAREKGKNGVSCSDILGF